MKIILLSFVIATVILTGSNGCFQKQNDDKQIIARLKEYYYAHSNIWSVKPPFPSNILDAKLDSLQKKYCTPNLRSKAKNQLKYGQDLMTNDNGIDSLGFATLTILKDKNKNNVYIVSYTTLNELVPNISKKEIKVILHVSVIKDNEIIKIDDIK